MDVLAYTQVEVRGHLTGVVFHPPCIDETQVIGFGGKYLYFLSHLAAHLLHPLNICMQLKVFFL